MAETLTEKANHRAKTLGPLCKAWEIQARYADIFLRMEKYDLAGLTADRCTSRSDR